jgi:hypothetical protein
LYFVLSPLPALGPMPQRASWNAKRAGRRDAPARMQRWLP